jgi:thiol-disulfide isomerase/thioredoxin
MKHSIITLSLVTTISFIATLAQAQETAITSLLNSQNLIANQQLNNQQEPPMKNSSGTAEIALAKHLKNVKAKIYGAYWCPHCHDQKELFGKEAWPIISYIECDPKGKNPRPDLCKKAKIKGYPTWEIKGNIYAGTQTLENLANASGYKGKRNFKN